MDYEISHLELRGDQLWELLQDPTLPFLDREELIQEFIKKQFGFMVNQVMQTPYRFLGWEPQQDVIWVYVEIPTQQSLSGVFLKNSLLVETFPDQTNLVHVSRKGDKKSYLFQKGKEVQQLN